jgi:hypothetical protein
VRGAAGRPPSVAVVGLGFGGAFLQELWGGGIVR